VGNKPDTGAKVILVPKGQNGVECKIMFLDLMNDSERDRLKQQNVFYATVGGTGRAVFNKVEPGDYEAFLISENTTLTPEIFEHALKALKATFTEKSVVGIPLNKVHFMKISVGDGESLEFEHDFGITHF
jgi:hypothetical protein